MANLGRKVLCSRRDYEISLTRVIAGDKAPRVIFSLSYPEDTARCWTVAITARDHIIGSENWHNLPFNLAKSSANRSLDGPIVPSHRNTV